MEDVILRPSMKTVWMAWIATGLLILASLWAIFHFTHNSPGWLALLPLLLLLLPLKRHLNRSFIVLRLQGEHLTLESGFLSRTRRTVDMAKIQDVTVSQTLAQRLLGTGDLTMETAGEAGRMGIRNLDRPRVIADAILNTSKQRHTLY